MSCSNADSGETIVAVIDTGFIRHEDLLDNMLKVAGSETDVYGYYCFFDSIAVG
jgi:hypothetical protein